MLQKFKEYQRSQRVEHIGRIEEGRRERRENESFQVALADVTMVVVVDVEVVVVLVVVVIVVVVAVELGKEEKSRDKVHTSQSFSITGQDTIHPLHRRIVYGGYTIY